jgi:beta-lactamase regulating signal transducer with metallopeptidase domain
VTPAEAVGNLAAFALQLGALVATARVLEAALPIDRPRVRLTYWQAVLVLGLVLPFVQPWHVTPTPAATLAPVSAASASMTLGSLPAPADLEAEASMPTSSLASMTAESSPRSVPIASIVLGVLAAGCVVAALRLGRAARALRRARLRSRPLDDGAAPSHAEVRVSDDVASPVTYGARRPVILLPSAFLRLDPDERAAVICHEQVHIERHHWLAQMFEEMLRVLLWFHPAFHWLLGRLRLAREQAVDAEVVQRLRCRTSYLEALVRLAASGRASSLVPAPTFFTRSHLAERVDLLLKEESMSRVRVLLSLASSAAAVALCAVGTIALVPFHASAEPVTPPAPPVPPSAMVALPALPPAPPIPAMAAADAPDVPPAPPAPPARAAKPVPPAPPKAGYKDEGDASDDEREALREARRQLAEEREALEKARRHLEEQSARIGEQAAKMAAEMQGRMQEQLAKVQEQAQKIAEEQLRKAHEQTAQLHEQTQKAREARAAQDAAAGAEERERERVRRTEEWTRKLEGLDPDERVRRVQGMAAKITEFEKRCRMYEEQLDQARAALRAYQEKEAAAKDGGKKADEKK